MTTIWLKLAGLTKLNETDKNRRFLLHAKNEILENAAHFLTGGNIAYEKQSLQTRSVCAFENHGFSKVFRVFKNRRFLIPQTLCV